MAAVIRPAPRLTRLVGGAALFGLAAVASPLVVVPLLAYAVVVSLAAAYDVLRSRGGIAPDVRRVLPARAIRGTPFDVVYRIASPTAASATTVDVLDELPADLGGDLHVAAVVLAPGETREVSRSLTPTRSGLRELGATFVVWPSRLRLFLLRAEAGRGGTIGILPPAAAAQRRGGLTHRALREELGVRPRPARGEGSEFESLREYVAGDDPRHIDWRATARRGRPIVRQHQTERRHTVIVAVDTGRLMASRVEEEPKLDRALDCAIALARASQEFGDRIGLVAFDRELRAFARPRPGPVGVGQLVEATLTLRPSPFETSYRVLLEIVSRHQKKRALLVVLTDFVEGSASAELESHLAILAKRHLVLLVALRDRLMAEIDTPAPHLGREDLYRRLALQDLVVEREAALSRVARFGAQTLDLDPARVTVPVLNRYLAIRQAALL